MVYQLAHKNNPDTSTNNRNSQLHQINNLTKWDALLAIS
jgi:hypothetical protein